ncbi:MAG: hypothetical protein ABW201_04485 [Candidatus Thiodiazotropha sp.]
MPDPNARYLLKPFYWRMFKHDSGDIHACCQALMKKPYTICDTLCR